MSKIEASDMRVQDIDHWGLIAGICDSMGLVEQLDRLLGTHRQEIVTKRPSNQSDDFKRVGVCQRPTVPVEMQTEAVSSNAGTSLYLKR
jgi:Domain of unknown function (DUF4277)